MTDKQYQPKTLICRNCGVEFTFEPGEQAFFDKKVWPPPVRCLDCHKEIKRKKWQAYPD